MFFSGKVVETGSLLTHFILQSSRLLGVVLIYCLRRQRRGIAYARATCVESLVSRPVRWFMPEICPPRRRHSGCFSTRVLVCTCVLAYSLYVISRSPSTVPIPSTHKPSTVVKPGSVLNAFLKLAVPPSLHRRRLV